MFAFNGFSMYVSLNFVSSLVGLKGGFCSRCVCFKSKIFNKLKYKEMQIFSKLSINCTFLISRGL